MLTDTQVYQVRQEVLDTLRALGIWNGELGKGATHADAHDVVARPVVAFSAPHPNHKPTKADLATLRAQAEHLEKLADEADAGGSASDTRDELEARIENATQRLQNPGASKPVRKPKATGPTPTV